MEPTESMHKVHTDMFSLSRNKTPGAHPDKMVGGSRHQEFSIPLFTKNTDKNYLNICSFSKDLDDILNGQVCDIKVFKRTPSLEFYGNISEISSNYFVEHLFNIDPVSYIAQKPNGFPIVSRILANPSSASLMFGIKHYTGRKSLVSGKSKHLVQADIYKQVIFHHFGDQISLCTKGNFTGDKVCTCLCEYLPLLCYKVSFVHDTINVLENNDMITSSFQFLHNDYLADLMGWHIRVIEPCGLDTIVSKLGSPYCDALVYNDELMDIYGVDDRISYNIPVETNRGVMNIDFHCHKFDTGEIYIFESEMRDFISYVLGVYLNHPQMFEIFTNLYNLPSDLSSKIMEFSEASNKLSGLVEGAESFILWLKQNSFKIALLAIASGASYIFLRAYLSNDYEPMQRLCAMLPLALSFVPVEIKDLFSFLTETSIKAEAPEDIPWESIVTLLFGATQFAAGMNSERFRYKDVAQILATLPKAVDGTLKVLSSLTDVVTLVFEKVKLYIFDDESLPDTKSIYPRVQVFLESAVDVITLAKQGKLTVNVYNYDRIVGLEVEGLKLISHGKFGPDSREVVAKIKTLLTMLTRERRPFDSSTIRCSFSRVEPLALLLRGASAVGKSTMSKPFIECLLSKLLPISELRDFEKCPDQYIYSRAPETKFWDGYKGQFVTVMDDFGQSYDVAGDPDNEYMSLIRCCNRFPYMLHMASMEDKGSTVFNSKVVFCTTNETNFQTVASIKCKEALIRRFDYIVDVIVNPEKDENGNYLYGEFREGCSDLKIKKNIEFTTDAWRINLIEGCNESSSGRIKQTMSFESFVQMCAGTYLAKVDAFEGLNASCTDLLSENISQRLKDSYNDYANDRMTKSQLDDYENYLDCKWDPFEEQTESAPKTGVLLRLYEQSGAKICYKQFLKLYDYFVTVYSQGKSEFFHYFHDVEFNSFYKRVESYYEEKKSHYASYPSYVESIYNKYTNFVGKYLSELDKFMGKWFTSIQDVISTATSKYPILFFFGLWATISIGIKAYIYITEIVPHSNPKLSRKKNQGKPTKSGKVSRYDDHEYAGNYEAPDFGCLQISQKVFAKNVLKLSLPGNEPDDNKSGLVIGICGNICMLPGHYIHKLETSLAADPMFAYESVEFYLTSGKLFRTITVDQFLKNERHEIPNQDMFLFSLNGGALLFPNIVKHFASQNSIDRVDQIKGTLFSAIACTDDGKNQQQVLATKCGRSIYYTDSRNNQFHANSAFQYDDSNTQSGDCGSILFHDNSNLCDGLIFGVHVAGMHSMIPGFVRNRGFASIISREVLELTLDLFNKIDCQGPVFDHSTMKETNDEFLFGEFPIIAEVPDNLSLSCAGKTNLVQMDEFIGVLGPCNIQPAHLKPFNSSTGERIDPFRKAICKYAGTQKVLDSKLVKLCAEHTFNDMEMNSKVEVPRNILTFEEAVQGMADEDFINGIPRGTSCGWPKVKTKESNLKGKKYWFGEDGEYDFSTPQAIALKQEVHEILEKAFEGKRSSVIFMDCLKDETRPKEKVDQGKTRLISAAPLAYLIACRMVFMRFSQWVMKNRIGNSVAVGTNPYEEWGAVVEHLHKVSDKMFAGDYVGYDSGQVKQVGDEICEGINKWYSDDEKYQRARRMFFLDIYSSVHIYWKYIYQWLMALPSGHPLTTIINSIYGNILLRMGFVHCMDQSYSALKLFAKYVRTMVYGDDNIVSVAKEVRHKFNIVTFAEFIRLIGMDYTDESKSETLNEEWREIQDINFLKRGFIYDKTNKKYLAPLAWETLRQMLYYLNKNIDQVSVVHSASDSFVRELALHPKEVFDDSIQKLLPIWAGFGYYPKTTDHALAREITLGSQFQY